MDRVKILIAEDHTIVRDGIRAILEADESFTIVGEAANGVQALSLLAGGLEVDVVLTDISMPEMDGLELGRALQEKYPEIKTIILSMMSTEQYIYEAFNIGINGYLLKNAGPTEMMFAIHEVYRGREFVCNEIGVNMMHRARKGYGGGVLLSEDVKFTNREREILALITEGYTNAEIADKIFTSKRTVEGHRQHLIDKTGTRNTAQLITFAIRQGII